MPDEVPDEPLRKLQLESVTSKDSSKKPEPKPPEQILVAINAGLRTAAKDIQSALSSFGEFDWLASHVESVVFHFPSAILRDQMGAGVGALAKLSTAGERAAKGIRDFNEPQIGIEVPILVFLEADLGVVAAEVEKCLVDMVAVDPAQIERANCVLKAFDLGYQRTYVQAKEGDDRKLQDECGQHLPLVLKKSVDFARKLVGAVQADDVHLISIVEAGNGEWIFRDGDKTVTLGNSAKRCLLTLAVLRDKPGFTVQEFAQFYAGQAKVDKGAATKTFDNAAGALHEVLPRFDWDAEPHQRRVKGIAWLNVADTAVMQTSLEYLVPAK